MSNYEQIQVLLFGHRHLRNLNERKEDIMPNKILVVDDDLNICELLKLYLENDGYTVFTAND